MFHYVGTSIIIVLLLRRPQLALSLATAALAGLAAFPFLRSLPSGVPEMAIMAGVYLMTGVSAPKSWRATLLPLIIGYGFAWVGHFGFEGNKPATFIYPTYSLMGAYW